MSIVLVPVFPAQDAPERGRGGFIRNPMTDSPWVVAPDGATVKSGKRKGEPKLVMYGSPSGYGKQIENQYNLTKWGERQAMLGVALDWEVAEKVRGLLKLEPNTPEFKEAADKVVAQAKIAAKANLAADRGTHGHLITEDFDRDGDIILRIEAGEALGLSSALQQAIGRAWNRMLVEYDLEILAVEASCVNDDHRLAGTLDRIVRARRDIEIDGHVIEAGTVFVLDVKTGKLHRHPSGNVHFKYWVGYAIQIYVYAASVRYNTITGERTPWPWDVSTTDALIAHIDIAHALETGEMVCRLVYVDLTVGKRGAEICRDAKGYAKAHGDMFALGPGDVVEKIEGVLE